MTPNHAMKDDKSHKGTIVVIDDTPANLRLLAGMLMKQGYKVRPMPNGELGLKTVLASPPDLILLDINMPMMDGYEVCQRLKANPLTSNIPVIFISALDEALDKVRAFNVGGVDYITKPFQLEEVQARIKTQLDLKYSRDSLEKANRHLQQALDEKNEFFGIMVHDLKNPLNALLGYSEMLGEDPVPVESELKQIAEKMVRTTEKMHELVVQILEMNSLELGKKAFHISPQRVTGTVETVVKNFQVTATSKNIVLEFECPESLRPAMVDEKAVFSISENLISNAVKFSPQGKRVQVSLSNGDEGIIYRVTDHGPGFTEEDKNKLFGKYARLSAKPTGGENSTGLGLSIVKKLTEIMNGKVWCHSIPGRETTFFVQLPFAPETEPTAQ